jgi:hypothetical protein
MILLMLIFPRVYSDEKKELNELIIHGQLDLSTSAIIQKRIDELKEESKKIQADIYKIQDDLVSKSKDNLNLKITFHQIQVDNKDNFGVIQMYGALNHVPMVEYDAPLVFEKEINLPLFVGDLPLGKYEFKIHAVVGQLTEKWPFILPEGRWSIEKNITVDGFQAGESKEYSLFVATNDVTGMPELRLESEKVEK